MRVPSAIALAGTVLALAVPGAALAQGAGDQEYTDPFGAGQGDTATPTPTATPQPATATPAPVAPAATAAPARPQLPYTGSPVGAGLLAAAGGLLLAGGITLRVRLRGQP